MSILINKDTRVLVQGITGRDGSFHAAKMREYGTNIVGGVSPGKGGTSANGVPVFNSMKEAVKETEADTTVIFVPAAFAADSIAEAADSGVKLIVAITEEIPVLDMMKIKEFLKHRDVQLIGPNCPGLITPGESLIGILPGSIFAKGNIGLMSRSGTLTYEAVDQLTKSNMGQTTCVGIGGDPVHGLYFQELLEMFENDPETEGIVMIGEIGGDAEEKAAQYIKEHVTKPVVSFIAGQTAPPGKRMGHAGAIIQGGQGTAESKIKELEAANVPVVKHPGEIPNVLKSLMK